MSDEKNELDEILKIDASHLLDKEPTPTVEKSVMPMPVGVRDVTPEGEVIRDVEPGDAPAAVIPAEVIRGVTSEELQKRAKVLREPCPDCQFFSFPARDSIEYRKMVGFFAHYLSGLPDWMKPSDAASRPDEWGLCKGAPHGRHGPVHMLNSCPFWRKKVCN